MKKKRNTTGGWAAWAECEACEDWVCRIHRKHVADCACPGPHQWRIDPRDPGSYALGRKLYGAIHA